MSSLILRTAAGVLMPLLLIYGIFLLLRGHNAPGGGFAGGLVVAAAYSLNSIAFGTAAARRALIVDPVRLIGVGLLSRSEAASHPAFGKSRSLLRFGLRQLLDWVRRLSSISVSSASS